jgi:tRNA dimethylallyltransferase
MEKKRVIIIAGSTASGKSEFAINLALEQNGVIINADASQIYMENTILSAQPNIIDCKKTQHLMYGYISGKEKYSVSKWLSDVDITIKNILSQDKVPILVGGTGMYLNALENGLSEIPEIAIEVKEETANIIKQQGIKALYEKLKMRDFDSAAKLNSTDTYRVTRAYEVIKSTGKSILWWQNNAKKHHCEYDLYKILLDLDRKIIYQRCEQRLLKMLDNGAIQEVQNIINLNIDAEMPIMKTIGIKQIIQYLNNEISQDVAIKLAQQLTRNYAKRQSTWFRHQFKYDKIITNFL